MTTVLYNHKERKIALDSRISNGGFITSDEFDKTITNEKGTWFFCGDTCDYEEMSKLSHGDKVNTDNLPDCMALLVDDDSGVYCVIVNHDGYCKYTKTTYVEGIGSGHKYAIAALDFGKSCFDAVKYAAKKDLHTGGSIRLYDVDKRKFISVLDNV